MMLMYNVSVIGVLNLLLLFGVTHTPIHTSYRLAISWVYVQRNNMSLNQKELLFTDAAT